MSLVNLGKLTIEELLRRNKEFAASSEFRPVPLFEEYQSEGADLPRICLVTCADPRAPLEFYLKLTIAAPVLSFRTINGHVTHIMNEILALDSFTGGLTDILVVHHSDCGASHFKNEEVRADFKKRAPTSTELDHVDFGAVTDIRQSIREDVAKLKANPFMRKELLPRIRGLYLDLKTGLISDVDS